MRDSTKAVIGTLERIRELLKDALIQDIRKDTVTYNEVREELKSIITKKLKYIDIIKETNKEIDARLERIAQDRFKLGCDQKMPGEPGYLECVKRQTRHVFTEANKKLESTKNKLEETKKEYDELQGRIAGLLHINFFIDISDELTTQAQELERNIAVITQSGEDIDSEQEIFLEQANDTLKDVYAIAEMMKEEFTKLEQSLLPPQEKTEEEPVEDTTILVGVKDLLEDLESALETLKKIHGLIAGKQLRHLGKILRKYKEQANEAKAWYVETSFGDFSTDRYDVILMDTSAIIDICTLATMEKVDVRRIMPPAWLEDKKLVLMDKVIEEADRIIAHDEGYGRTTRAQATGFTPRLSALFWDAFKHNWKHHVKQEPVARHSELVQDIFDFWLSTRKGMEELARHDGDKWTLKEYFKGTGDLAIILYCIRHHEKILIIARDKDIRDTINEHTDSHTQRVLSYVTTGEIGFRKRTLKEEPTHAHH